MSEVLVYILLIVSLIFFIGYPIYCICCISDGVTRFNRITSRSNLVENV
jgi:hypothetical protein